MSPQRYQEKFDVLRAEYDTRLEEWHEKVDPAVLEELNRRRVAKGRKRIFRKRARRPLTGYLRYVHKYTHFAVTILSKVSAINSMCYMSTQTQRKTIELILRIYLCALRISGRQ